MYALIWVVDREADGGRLLICLRKHNAGSNPALPANVGLAIGSGNVDMYAFEAGSSPAPYVERWQSGNAADC